MRTLHPVYSNPTLHALRIASMSNNPETHTYNHIDIESVGDMNHKGLQKSSTQVEIVPPSVPPIEESKEGLLNAKALFILFLWYFFSFITLFLNKYILTSLKAEAVLFATVQMIVTTLLGFFNMYVPCGMYKPVKRESNQKPANFYRNMIIVGSTRFLVVFLGLIALKYVAVSFTETIKSSAPIFTVVISRMMLGEKNGIYVQMSLLPIMSGLALCSAYELGFNIQGFFAALGTNISECPAEFQFYTCLASLLLQMPVCIILLDWQQAMATNAHMFLLMVLNGTSYHFQTMMAWVLMSFVSPVTHSVCNTVKRAILIWLSVLTFGNPVTFLSGLGTCIVTVGVLLYNKAREFEQRKRDMMVKYGSTTTPRNGDIRQL